MSAPQKLVVVRRNPDELSLEQIERQMAYGKREAKLIEELEEATRHGDKDLAWQIAQELCRVEDEAKRAV